MNEKQSENPYDDIIKTAKKLKTMYGVLLKNGVDASCENYRGFKLLVYSDKIVIKFEALDNLHDARKFAKMLYPAWSDKIATIWNPYDTNIIVSYQDSSYRLLELWFETTVENFPKSLKPNENCTFEKMTRDGPRYSLICPVVPLIDKQLSLIEEFDN